MIQEKQKKTKKPKQTAESELLFTKEQLLASRKYEKDKDILSAALEDGEYTETQVAEIILQFRKGRVKLMAFGGGLFTTQNKVLPGHYMNFVSAARASSAISDRGFVSVPMELNWGEDGKVFTIESADFQKRSMEILGYAYDAPELKPLRDLFLNARTAYLYRLNSGEKAENAYGTAKYTGTRGNDIRIVIQANVDEPEKFDVITYLGASKVDSQTVGEAAELEENSFVRFKKDIQLEATAGAPMSGGVNKEEITGDDHQAALVKLEAYTCNILICTATDEKMKKLYAAFTKRLRDETGVKFQTVIYGYAEIIQG